jgi:hypothetical protein
LENIPSVYKAKFDDKEWVKDYLTKERGLVNPAVILPKLLIRTVIEYHSKDENGKDIKCRVGISCKSLDTIHFVNLNELMVDKIHSDYIRVISKLLGTNLPANADKPDLSIFKDSKEIRVGQTTISSANNEEMYHYLVDYCFKKPCIYMIPGVGSTIQKLSLLIDTFKGLDLIKQCKTLIQMVSMCTCKTRNVDLTTLGLSKTSAIVRGPKFLSFGTKIIAQSITGFYEKVLFTVPDKEGE